MESFQRCALIILMLSLICASCGVQPTPEPTATPTVTPFPTPEPSPTPTKQEPQIYQKPGDYLVRVERVDNDGFKAVGRLHVRVTARN